MLRLKFPCRKCKKAMKWQSTLRFIPQPSWFASENIDKMTKFYLHFISLIKWREQDKKVPGMTKIYTHFIASLPLLEQLRNSDFFIVHDHDKTRLVIISLSCLFRAVCYRHGYPIVRSWLQINVHIEVGKEICNCFVLIRCAKFERKWVRDLVTLTCFRKKSWCLKFESKWGCTFSHFLTDSLVLQWIFSILCQSDSRSRSSVCSLWSESTDLKNISPYLCTYLNVWELLDIISIRFTEIFSQIKSYDSTQAKIFLNFDKFVYMAAILDSVTSPQFPTDCRCHLAKCEK